MPVFRNLGLTSLQLSMRVREAGFRRYSAKPEHVSPHYNRHWYRHILVAFSPGGRIPLPFQVWLGFPDGILIICYHMGMMRDMLVSSCSPDWGHVERFATDLDLKLDEDTGLLTEKLFLGLKPAYCAWWYRARVDFSIPVESFLDPPAVCFRPDRKDQLSKFHKYGLMSRCYDLVRQKVSPIPFGEKAVRLTFDVVSSRIWSRSYQWLDKI